MVPMDTELGPAADSLQGSVVERVAAHLQDEIRQGRLPAGTRLIQGEIAARLGVSGTSVREAFYVLENLRLVTWDGRRGASVFEPSPQNLVEVYNIRAALESLAVQIAAPRLDQSDIDQLDSLLAEMERLHLADNQFLALNARFHGHLVEKSGSGRLARLIDAQQTAASAYIVFLGGVEPESTRRTHLEHRAILAALRTGDADLAAAAMRAHLTARARALEMRLASPHAHS
jgi:DNA-binding GntR family transcriptional regulator